MKRFIALLVTAVLLVSMFGVVTAFAGPSISGNSQVLAGKSYTYTGKMTCTGADMVGKIEGLGQVNSLFDAAGGSEDESLSGKAEIRVTIPSDAKPGDKYTITLSGQYSATEGGVKVKHSFSKTKTITVVSKISSSSDSSGNSTPKTPKPPTEWDIAKQNVQAMETGGTVTVDITKDPKIPASVLSSIKEKQGVLTLNYGGYTCTINGAALANIPEKMDPIDFSVSMEKDEALSSALGGQDAYQLHFAHSGQLPGKFTYTFKAEGHAPGDILYLYYYYDQSGVIEGMQSAQVDANGFITFDIYHCSSYFVSANAIEGATGRDFTADAANAQALSEAQAQIETLQTQLTEAQAENKELQTQLDSYKAQPSSSPELIAASASAPVGELFGIPYVSFIAAMLGVALITMLFTMMACRAGVFKKKKRNREDIL